MIAVKVLRDVLILSMLLIICFMSYGINENLNKINKVRSKDVIFKGWK